MQSADSRTRKTRNVPRPSQDPSGAKTVKESSRPLNARRAWVSGMRVRSSCGVSNLQNIFFFSRDELIDFLDVPVSHLLQLLLQAFAVVFRNFVIF